MSAGTDMNQKIISMNLDMMEEQRLHMHSVLDQYVDQVITAGSQWTRNVERNQSSFVKVHKIITNAMEFLSFMCDKIEHEHFSCFRQETANLIGKDELPQQQKHVLMDSCVDNTGDFSVAEPIATNRKSKQEDSHDIRNPHTCREPNLESDQQMNYEDFYNQLQNLLAKQDKLDQQVDMKFNDLRAEMESLKLNVDQINTDLTAKVGEVSTNLSEKVDVINTDLSDRVDEIKTELSSKVDEIKTELSDKADRINTDDLSDKIDEINTELSDKVDETYLTAKVNKIDKKFSDKVDKIYTVLTDKINEINIELSEKIDEINTDLSDKVGELNTKVSQIYTDLSTNVDQINVVLKALSNSEQEHAAQINKLVDLENHVNTVENDLQNNVRHVESKLDEVGTNYRMIRELFVNRLVPLEKLRDILNDRATSQSENIRQLQAVMAELKDLSDVVKKPQAEVVAFNAETRFTTNKLERSRVCSFPPPRLISGCKFDSTTGIFTAVVDGFYLVYISLSINHAGDYTIYLMHRNKSQGHSVQICLAKAEIEDSTVSNIGIVELKVDDELFITSDGDFSFFNLEIAIQFSCLRFQ